MSIGQNIKKYRKEKGYTQRTLAELLGVSVQAVSKWETNAGAPDISQVVPLAQALEISTDTLFDYNTEENLDEFARMRNQYGDENEVFRCRKYSRQNYELLSSYCLVHTGNSEAALWCLKCLADLIGAGECKDRSDEELLTESERYANCIFRNETNADTVFMTYFILARVYQLLGRKEKAEEVLKKVPVTFGDRFYWEAEIAQANREYDKAMELCRKSFAGKARYISRCLRIAGEMAAQQNTREGLELCVEYEEYMLRMIEAFLTGGDYLPCRQIFQKHVLLVSIVDDYITLGKTDLAIARAETLFAGREAFHRFLKNPQGKTTLLLENDDSYEDQIGVKNLLDEYAKKVAGFLKGVPEYTQDDRIKNLLRAYKLL